MWSFITINMNWSILHTFFSGSKAIFQLRLGGLFITESNQWFDTLSDESHDHPIPFQSAIRTNSKRWWHILTRNRNSFRSVVMCLQTAHIWPYGQIFSKYSSIPYLTDVADVSLLCVLQGSQLFPSLFRLVAARGRGRPLRPWRRRSTSESWSWE